MTYADTFETDAGALESDTFESGGLDELDEAENADARSPFSEVEEMELAAELLEVTDEAELDQFIGGLIMKAARAGRKLIKSPVGQKLGGLLKGAVKKALPKVGAAVGDYLSPGQGGDLGSQVAEKIGQLLGLELEGLSAEDQEFEAAKQLVRLAGAATSSAAAAAPSATASAVATARQAVVQAARRYAPGLVRPVSGAFPGAAQCRCRRRRAGRWIRSGRKVILLGV